jgi:hypothetical protein
MNSTTSPIQYSKSSSIGSTNRAIDSSSAPLLWDAPWKALTFPIVLLSMPLVVTAGPDLDHQLAWNLSKDMATSNVWQEWPKVGVSAKASSTNDLGPKLIGHFIAKLTTPKKAVFFSDYFD